MQNNITENTDDVTKTPLPDREPITIYHCNPKTGEFMGQGLADPDPMDYENWLIPAHACSDAPPEAEQCHAVVRVGGKYGEWQQVIDRRGTEYWLSDGSKYTIDELGVDIPDDALLSPPEPSIEEKFQAEMDALNSSYEREQLKLANEYSIAIARDGSVESEKVQAARDKINELDLQFQANQQALIDKYYGG